MVGLSLYGINTDDSLMINTCADRSIYYDSTPLPFERYWLAVTAFVCYVCGIYSILVNFSSNSVKCVKDLLSVLATFSAKVYQSNHKLSLHSFVENLNYS